jgi:hypothetical protein
MGSVLFGGCGLFRAGVHVAAVDQGRVATLIKLGNSPVAASWLLVKTPNAASAADAKSHHSSDFRNRRIVMAKRTAAIAALASRSGHNIRSRSP